MAQRCQKAIEDKFGKKSVRVALLEGQRLESERKYEDAEALYKTLLKDEPTSAKVMKRATAIKMAQQVRGLSDLLVACRHPHPVAGAIHDCLLCEYACL